MLENVRIVELAQGLAGPVASLMLAELGAEVVKVEPPGGDPGRAAAAFATWNRSKRSIELDVDSAAGLAQLKALLADADVLLHDLPPSRAKALGLDDAALEAAYPQLISCSVLGSPINHRDAERAADELLVQARHGILDQQFGYRTTEPVAYRYPVGSWGAVTLAAAGILTRLIMRLETGKGGGVHTSLLQGAMTALTMVWSRTEHGVTSMQMPRTVEMLQIQMYECGDGKWMQIMDPTGKLDWAALPLMWDVMAEGYNIDDPIALREAIKKRPMAEWLAGLQAADVAVEPCYSMGDVLSHPEAVANTYVVEVDDPTWGKTKQSGVPLHMSDPVKVKGPAPKVGEHNAAPWSGARAPLAPAKGRAAGDRPLPGLKVIDFGAFLAGPMAPGMLGDMGANVIKVEPITGDRMRFMVRYFQACNRNKRSLAVDLTKPEGQEILGRLAKWADIAHHNMRIKAASKMNLDEASLRKLNPNLVFSYVSAYGLKGSRADWPGYDSVFQAIAGWNTENAGEGNKPIFNPVGAMDILCATTSLVGTLAALYATKATGKPASAEGSLLGVSCLTQSETMITEKGLAPFPKLDHDQTGVSPLNRIYKTADGKWVAVAAQRREADLLAAFGVASLDGLVEAAAKASQADLLAKLDAKGVPAEAVIDSDSLNKAFDDAANKESQVVIAYKHAEAGLLEQPGAYWKFSDVGLSLDNPIPPPLLGEHTDEILAELGYSADEIKDLREKKIVAG